MNEISKFIPHCFSRLVAILLLCVVGVFPTAQAQQNVYIGAGFGQSDVDDSAADNLITSGTVDGEDSGLKIFAGFGLNKNLSVEVSYIDLGETTYSGLFNGQTVENGKIEIDGFNFSLVGMFPVSPKFSILGRVGMFIWDAEANDITDGAPFSASDDGTDLSFGFGANYNFTKQIGARAEWERFDASDADADLLSVSVIFKF